MQRDTPRRTDGQADKRTDLIRIDKTPKKHTPLSLREMRPVTNLHVFWQRTRLLYSSEPSQQSKGIKKHIEIKNHHTTNTS